jgi:outer membrane protein assembly factor BamB/PKD repeat protein
MLKKTFSGIMLTILLISTLLFAVKLQPVKASVDWWPMFHHDLRHTGYSTSKAPNTNQTLWTYTTGGAVAFSSPAVVDGKAFIGSDDSKVYALDASTGAFLWSYTTGGGVSSSPAVADGKVYVGSGPLDKSVYALDANTGALVWKYTTGGAVDSSPAVADGKVFVGSSDKYLYALDAITGALVWKAGPGLYGALSSSSPAVADGKVYISARSPFDLKPWLLRAYDASTGEAIWNYNTGSRESSAAVADGRLFVGSYQDFKVYALDANTGALIWSYTTGSNVYSSPAVADGKVFIGSGDHKVYALDANTGTPIWSYTTGGGVSSSPAVADGKVFVGSGDGKLYAFGFHDVAITSVTPSTTLAGVGQVININVVAKNEGTETETFDVTAYYDDAVIQTKTVTNLAPDTSATVVFYWNTMGVAFGTYTIKAIATTAPGETDTADNTKVDGTVAIVKEAYHPSGVSLLGQTEYVGGSLTDLQYDDGVYMAFKSYLGGTPAPRTLYAHQEAINIAGIWYWLLKVTSADTGGTTLIAPSWVAPRYSFGPKFVYSLRGVSSIPSSTWTFVYRAAVDSGVGAHIDVDVRILKADGTIRQVIASYVADSPTLPPYWTTVPGYFGFPGYTVVDQSDYLLIEYYAHITSYQPGLYVGLRVDDATLPPGYQTSVQNVYLPLDQIMEVEFFGQSNTNIWTELAWAVRSAWDAPGVAVTLQLYDFAAGSYPTSGDGYISYTSSATPYTPETKSQTIITNPTHFRDGSGNWRIKVTGIKSNTLSPLLWLADSISFLVKIPKPPVAYFSYSPEHPTPSTTIIFNASLSTPNGGNIVSYAWNFGDGNTTTIADPIITHIYISSGTYNVTLTITDSEGLTDTTWAIIEVMHPWNIWTRYHNYAEIVETLLHLNSTYPNIVDVFSIGKSWQNRDIYCIRLTNESITHPKPKVFFVGYHHAREPISAELPLYFAVEAATNFGTNETITHMLNYSEIYIVPMLNVDAFEAFKQNEWQRKNVHPFDEDNDTLFDEDPPDDANGNGYIEDLIQWNGSQWVFVRWEGKDDDSDGSYNEDWVGGVDLNRNYGYEWNATCYSGSPYTWAEDYRGPAPFSEPETQAMRDLALAHDFKYAISFHSGTEIIGYPWGYTTDPTPDDAIFREVAANLSALVGAPYGQNSFLYTMSGSWDDWMYANRSTFALTCEIYTNNTAWQYEPGPEPDTLWEKGVFQFFNPDPNNIETVIQRWLPVFTYTTNRAITEAYDTATTNVTPLKTIVGQGYSVHINVTVANQGEFTETFNVKVYANTTVISQTEVTLTSGNSTTITFTWNTIGFAKGNYTISAFAWPVLGETRTADNTFMDGWVKISIYCDVNGDGIVDISDILDTALAFGSTSGQPRWNPNCDLDDNGIVDISDILEVALHYGETDP